MIRTFNNRFQDYSIIDINEQNSGNIEYIREGLNKEFEWDGPLLSFHALKGHWLPLWNESTQTKKHWVCDCLFMLPTYINTWEWEIETYWANEKSVEKPCMSVLLSTCYCNLLLVVRELMYIIKSLNFDFTNWPVCFVWNKWPKLEFESMSTTSLGMGNVEKLEHLLNW